MKRRKFISGLGLAPLFGVPSFLDESNTSLEKVNITKKGNPQIDYRGFDIRWSGYLKQYDTEKITGFYIAWNEEYQFGFYSCLGGVCTDYQLGHTFATHVLKDHKFLTIRSSEEDKEEEKKRAFNRLKDEIDSYIDKAKPLENYDAKN